MRSAVARALVLLCLARQGLAQGQQSDTTARDTTAETGVSAGESEAEPPRRRLVKWNEYDGPLFSLRVGAGFLVDYATYSQDAAAKEQLTLEPGFKIRDSRLARQRTDQDQATDHVSGRAHVRRLRRRVVRPPDRD